MTLTSYDEVERFATCLEQAQRARLAHDYPALDLESDAYHDAYHVKVTQGQKYTRVDFGSSGKYMVVAATGEIFRDYLLHAGYTAPEIKKVTGEDNVALYLRQRGVSALASIYDRLRRAICRNGDSLAVGLDSLD